MLPWYQPRIVDTHRLTWQHTRIEWYQPFDWTLTFKCIGWHQPYDYFHMYRFISKVCYEHKCPGLTFLWLFSCSFFMVVCYSLLCLLCVYVCMCVCVRVCVWSRRIIVRCRRRPREQSKHFKKLGGARQVELAGGIWRWIWKIAPNLSLVESQNPKP